MRRSLAPVLLLLLALVVAGCGGDGPSSDAAAAQPRRIVSLSPTSTEMLFAIGAGGQVVAVDSNSNYPEDAPKTELSAYEPNLEAIAAYKPDLVVNSPAGWPPASASSASRPCGSRRPRAWRTPTPSSTSSAGPPATRPRPGSSRRRCGPRSRGSPPPPGPSAP